MGHMHHGDAKKTQHSKIEKIVGRAENWRYAKDKADDRYNEPYYENTHLNPLTLPAQESVGPLPVGKPAGSPLKRK